MLVVKWLRGEPPKKEFEQRIMMIGAIQNDHVAPLHRYYYDQKMLVYSYFPEGSLSHMLHGDRASGIATLDLKQRITISLAAARGVAFIHSAGPSSCHGNIKSSNVLLSSTHDACVSEHGLITLGLTLELFPGAPGYRAPEIANHKLVSQEADVYSFGILLLELLSGKDPVKKTHFKEGLDLPHWLHSVARKKWAAMVFDVRLLEKQHKGWMIRLLELAMKCCSQDDYLRPTMSDIVKQIEDIYGPHS